MIKFYITQIKQIRYNYAEAVRLFIYVNQQAIRYVILANAKNIANQRVINLVHALFEILGARELRAD